MFGSARFSTSFRALAAVLIVGTGIQGCGGSGTTAVVPSQTAPTRPTTQQTGSVVLPAGVSIPVGSLTVTNSLGKTTPSSNGNFTITAYSGGPQFTMVTDASGNLVLAGFVGAPSSTTIDSVSTAKALMFFAGAFYMLTSPYRTEAIDATASTSGFPALQSAIEAALESNPHGLGTNAAVQNALMAAILALYPAQSTSAAKSLPWIAGRRPLSVAVSPSGMSGIQVLNVFPTGVGFMNSYRRTAEAFFDQDSYVNASGTRVSEKVADAVAPVSIPAVSGLGTSVNTFFINAIAGYFSGNTAYTPVTTATTNLPLVAGSLSTRYLVTVVGAGSNPGAINTVSTEQYDAQKFTSLLFLMQAIVLPFITSLVLPANSGTIDDYFTMSGASGALNDLIKTMTSDDPKIVTYANEGDMADAFTAALTAISKSSTYRNIILQTIVDALPAGESAAFYAAAKNVLNTLKALDAAITLADMLVVDANIASSNQADIYTVDVSTDKVIITPASASVMNGSTQTFTVTVPSASGSALTLVYHYANTATVGHLTDGIAGHLDNFDSTQSMVTYSANTTGEGTDTIAATAYYLSGASGSQRTQIGNPANATVTVGATPTPTPSVAASPTPTETPYVPPTFAPTATPTATPVPTPTPTGCGTGVSNGNFTQGFNCWTQTVVQTGSFSGYPRFVINTSGPCLSDPDSAPFFSMDVPGGAEGVLSQTFTVPSGSPTLYMLTWGNLDPVAVNLDITAGGSQTVLASFSPTPLSSTETTCSGAVPQVMSFNMSAYAGQTVTLGIDATAGGNDGTIANFTNIGFSRPSSTLVRVRDPAQR